MKALPEGETWRLEVTTADPVEVSKIRALGHGGLMAYGGHHLPHHWMLGTGRHPHRH